MTIGKIRINMTIVIVGLFFFMFYSTFGYFYATNTINALTQNKYREVSETMKGKLLTLIEEKQEAILLITVSLAQNQYLKDILIRESGSSLELETYSKTLRETTSLKNLWFQVLDKNGISLYRSWTQKRGDSLVDARADVAKMLEYPHIISSISTGIYDMTFKTMVPIYNDGKFIGIVETIAKFNSIVEKMQESDMKTLILVDASYKQQLTKAFTKRFIQDYYITSLETDSSLIKLVQETSVENFLDIKNYRVDEKNGLLIALYKLADINGKEMSYFIIAKDLSKINLLEAKQTRDRIVMGLVLGFIIITGFLSFLYVINYRKFLEAQQKNLQEQVEHKTKALKLQSEELRHIANHDFLTALPNRLLFLDRLKQLLKHSKRKNQSLSVFFLDLDRFKEVNDTYGHEVGDKLLQAISKNLQMCVREEDTIARLGGDEFTIILQNISHENIIKIADMILEKMKEAIIIDEIEMFVSFSIGISCYPEDGKSAELLIRNADTAMYRAKEKGRNNYQFYNASMTDQAIKRIELEKDIRRALNNDEFEPYYQPKVDATTLKVVGLEALVRWNHPLKGLIPPLEFIPFAEEVGLIAEIDAKTMHSALNQIKEWQAEGVHTGRLSLNVSAKQLESKDALREFKKTISDIDLDTTNVEFEITESQIMLNPTKAIEMLHSIKELGIKIAVDDFGTGYSSLAYLKDLPVDTLKIDRSFIIDLYENEDDQAIVKTIIALAQNLKLNLVAEGVETQEQLDFLLLQRCNVIQGYFFSKPLPSHDCKAFLLSHQ